MTTRPALLDAPRITVRVADISYTYQSGGG